MPKQYDHQREDQTVHDMLTVTDKQRDAAAVAAAGQRLAARTDAEIAEARTQLREDHVGVDARTVDAFRRR